jgi:hypothetical protein
MNIHMNEFYGVGIRDTLHGVLVHFGSFNDDPQHGKKLIFVSNSSVGKFTSPFLKNNIDLLLPNHPKT